MISLKRDFCFDAIHLFPMGKLHFDRYKHTNVDRFCWLSLFDSHIKLRGFSYTEAIIIEEK